MHFPLVKIVKNKVASQKAAICLSIRLDGQIRMLALLAASLLIIHILLTTVHLKRYVFEFISPVVSMEIRRR